MDAHSPQTVAQSSSPRRATCRSSATARPTSSRGFRRSSSTTPYSSPSSGKTSPRGRRIHSSLSSPRRRGWTSSSASSGPGSALRSPSTRPGQTAGAYESGTVYELETAAESYQSRGTPDLVVYRRTSDPSLPLHDEAERQRRLEQLEALEAFIRRWFFHDDGSFKAAFHTFKTPDQFEQQLETHLRKLIREKVEKAEQPGGPGEGRDRLSRRSLPGPEGVWPGGRAGVLRPRAGAGGGQGGAHGRRPRRNCAFLLIFGMSGSGKSSLVRAGLLHALTATPGWIEGVDVWRWCLVRPGDATGDPLDALAQAFFGDTALPELRAGGIDAARLARTLRDNPDDVDLILGPALRAVADSERDDRAAGSPLEARLLVVVDQMEELFTRDWLDEPGRARYVAALAALARSGLAWVVATMRSEFFARCAELPELVALKAGQGQLDLLPPTFAEIGQMIRYPRATPPCAGVRTRTTPARPSTTCSRKRPGATPRRCRSCNSRSTSCFAAATAAR